MLAYENEAITAQREVEDVDYVVPDQTILIENPVAVTKDAPPAAKALHGLLAQRCGAEDPGRKGYRPVDRTPSPGRTSPTLRALHDREVRRVGHQARSSSTPTTGSSPRSSKTSGCRRIAASAPAVQAPRQAASRPSWLGRGFMPPTSASSSSFHLCDHLEVDGERWGWLLAGNLSPVLGRGAQAELLRVPRRCLDQRGGGYAHRLGARADSFPRQGVRQRADRPPFALPTIVAGTLSSRSTARRVARHQHRLHAGRGRGCAALRDAPVSRPLGTARSPRARPRDGGGCRPR